MTKAKKSPKTKPVVHKTTDVQLGKAYSGEVFKDDIKTYDMVQSLLNPLVKKSFFDYLIIFLLAINVLVYYFLTSHKDYSRLVIPTFVVSYFFWRVSYNFGIGVILYKQSNYNSLTKFCDKYKLFNYSNEAPSSLQKFIELNFRIKYGDKYNCRNYPLDFNAWLLFRNFVDLILMQDFVNYFILFVACFVQNTAYSMTASSEPPLLFYSRWVFGILFILLNLIVKIDAHNVIKDFAWYWGDFFYLKINSEELIFDGIFELFPHPMYSIGYIGYYGFALLSNSYLVLIVSCIAHFTQFLFLHYVEDPHINKIYNQPEQNSKGTGLVPSDDYNIKFKPMVFFHNFSFLRATDYLIVTLNIALFAVLNFGAYNIDSSYLFLVVLVLKIGFTILTSVLLHLQSKFRSVTKIHLKYDLNYVDAFNNWCVYYNFQLLLNLNVLIALFIKEFAITNNIHSLSILSVAALFKNDTLFFFKLFIGTFLLFLNTICESSIMNTIGVYSWFYGDFWLPNLNDKKLTKTGIYKYLNNPEKFLGICGIWGLAVICIHSSYMFILAMVWSLCKILFISLVETPHMIKLYGENQVNYDSGFSKTFKKIIPKKLRDRESFSKLGKLFSEVKSESSLESSESNEDPFHFDDDPVSFHSPNPFVTVSKKNPDYLLELLNINAETNGSSSDVKLSVAVGTPIKFRYKVPKSHNKSDWIGLYKVLHTLGSTTKTLISSNNHWIAIDPKAYDNRYFGHENTIQNLNLYKNRLLSKPSDDFEEGILEFNNELLYWEPGVFEIRYHHSEGHNVILRSNSFEIRFDKIQLPTNLSSDQETFAFHQALYELFTKHNFLNFSYLQNNAKLVSCKPEGIETDYVELIFEYVNGYSAEILSSPSLKKNLYLSYLNSYNVDEFKKKQVAKLLKRLSYLTKNSIEHANNSSTNVNIEFSNDILMNERSLKNLFHRVTKVQRILDDIAN